MTQPPHDPYGSFPPPPTPGHSAPPQGQQPYPPQQYPQPYPQGGYPQQPYPPAGYPPPGYYAPPPRQPQPAGALAIWVIVTASIVLAFQAIKVVAAFASEDEYLQALARGESTIDVTTPYDGALALGFLTLIPAYVLTSLWLYRVRINREAMFPYESQPLSPGWAWGGWVVPIVNFWFPLLLVLGVARDPQSRRSPGIVGAWWTFWILYLVSSWVPTAVWGVDDADAVRAIAPAECVSAVLASVALVFWILVVRRVTSEQARQLGVRR